MQYLFSAPQRRHVTFKRPGQKSQRLGLQAQLVFTHG
jgi:hypothetical protein